MDELTAPLAADCFLCGRRIIPGRHDRSTFGPADEPLAPQLPLHTLCLNGRNAQQVADRYHLTVADLGGVARSLMRPFGLV